MAVTLCSLFFRGIYIDNCVEISCELFVHFADVGVTNCLGRFFKKILVFSVIVSISKTLRFCINSVGSVTGLSKDKRMASWSVRS